MAFSPDIVREIAKVAKANGIELAALLAVVEVESSGQPYEQDGVTPRFLYERHVMYRELKKRRGVARAASAIRAGLALPKWDRATQYQDQRNSTQRLALMKRAKDFDEECACRSASWGLGQTMGFHAESQGFKNAVEFVKWMTEGGVSAQITAMVKEIKKSGLVDEINRHDWAAFAYRYNGAGYKQNKYDERMAQAYAMWKTRLPKINLDSPVRPVPKPKPAPLPDVEPTPPDEDKPGWFGTVWRKVGAVLGTLTGLGSITWLTDWQIAAAFFTFVLLLVIFWLALFFWIYDAEDVRDWLKRKTGFGRDQ